MTDFWQLPTPRRFVRGIAEDLRAGNNVIITFPSHIHEGWFVALRREIRDLNLQKLETIDANGAFPLTSLANHLGLNPRRAGLRLTELCDAHEFHGRLMLFSEDEKQMDDDDYNAKLGFAASVVTTVLLANFAM